MTHPVYAALHTRARILGLTALLAIASGACSAELAERDLRNRPHKSNAQVDWRDQVIYQIVVDRFHNGNPNNDQGIEPGAPARYHGGDWRGITDKLDYLEQLGVTALWISPVVRNVEEDSGFASYHGYWMQDPLRTNAHFGELSELTELVDAAHARDMLVVLDVVTNHVGQLFYYDINANGRPDEWITGGGLAHTCVQICNNPARAHECSDDEQTYCTQGAGNLERISEWDPEFDPRGIQGWSATGFSGPADIRFLYEPEHNRTVPARPPAWFGWPDAKPWFDDPSWYSRQGRVYVWWNEGSYSQEFVRTQETTGDFVGGLKDLATDNPDVRAALIDAFAYWIEVADFDGFRIDTIKHMDRPLLDPYATGFVGEFTTAMRKRAAAVGKQNFFLFGEAFDGHDDLLGAYTFPGAGLDAVFYFSQKFRVFDAVFKHGAPTRDIECLYHSRVGTPDPHAYCAAGGFSAGPNYYDQPHALPAQGGTGLAPQQSLVNFVDNHDLARFLWNEPSPDLLSAALFFLFTWDGIPCIYYGTEQGFAGGNDPKNREDMEFDTGRDSFALTRDLIAMRREHIALRRGQVEIAWSSSSPSTGEQADAGIFAFVRAHSEETLLVVLNTAVHKASRTCLTDGPCMPVPFESGTVLRDIAPGSDGELFTVAADGTVDLAVPPRSGRLLAPE